MQMKFLSVESCAYATLPNARISGKLAAPYNPACSKWRRLKRIMVHLASRTDHSR